MPLKLPKTVINQQARKPILEILRNSDIDNDFDVEHWTQIDNSFFGITNTDEGQKLVEVTTKVRELSIKPAPQAENITFNTPQEMLQYLIDAKAAKTAKAKDKAKEKETLKEQNIARKAKTAEKTKSNKKETVDSPGAAFVRQMLEQHVKKG